MSEKYYFPFGQELKKVEQKDRSPKKAFVLGVYASAVHARWVDVNGVQKVAALAVASEPEIFWTGKDADKIIAAIDIPKELGSLTVPAMKNLNGPSGITLDNLYLKPLGLNRKNTWLCDLLPYSRVNEGQREALNSHYTIEIIKKYNLKPANIPDNDEAEYKSEQRIEEILYELENSKAETLILLGDKPILHFLRNFDKMYSGLAQFGENYKSYGKEHQIKINNKIYNVIPLCHPRQAGRLGRSSLKWGALHDFWVRSRMDE